jgi:DNA-binding GntR family transcriptional regulator
LAAQQISQEQLAALYAILEQTRELITLDVMSAQRHLNKKFHMSLVEAAGNTLLSKLYETVSNTFPDWMLYEYMFRHPELLQSSLTEEFKEHKAILDAIAAGDAHLAVKHVVTHIRHLGKEFENYLGIPGELLEEKERQIDSWFVS